jgi:hypothetical protein
MEIHSYSAKNLELGRIVALTIQFSSKYLPDSTLKNLSRIHISSIGRGYPSRKAAAMEGFQPSTAA